MALEKFIQTTGKKTIDTLYKAKKPLNKAQTTLDTINEIDLCNIINYFLNKAIPPGSQLEEQFGKLKAEVKKINDKIDELEESKTYTQLSDARSKQTEILSIINVFQVPEFVLKLIPQGGELIKQLKGTANNINDITFQITLDNDDVEMNNPNTIEILKSFKNTCGKNVPTFVWDKYNWSLNSK
jgi:hypothetical protein